MIPLLSYRNLISFGGIVPWTANRLTVDHHLRNVRVFRRLHYKLRRLRVVKGQPAATLNKTGVPVSLTGVDDPTVSGNGVTSGGVVS